MWLRAKNLKVSGLASGMRVKTAHKYCDSGKLPNKNIERGSGQSFKSPP